MRCRLIVPRGDLVTELDIPPFTEPPQVLLWGNRVFRLVNQNQGVVLYVEAFYYAVPA